MKNVCVYCGSSSGNSEIYKQATVALGALLARKQYRLVYGGGSTGLMGYLANAVLEGGGQVTGVIPGFLVEREREHRGLTDLVEVNSMHQRKQKMVDYSDGFIILPGGMGTMDEFFETTTWAQLGLHRKPIGILNVDGYFDLLAGFIDQMVKSDFLSATNRQLVIVEKDAETLLQKMEAYNPPDTEKWLNRYRT